VTITRRLNRTKRHERVRSTRSAFPGRQYGSILTLPACLPHLAEGCSKSCLPLVSVHSILLRQFRTGENAASARFATLRARGRDPSQVEFVVLRYYIAKLLPGERNRAQPDQSRLFGKSLITLTRCCFPLDDKGKRHQPPHAFPADPLW